LVVLLEGDNWAVGLGQQGEGAVGLGAQLVEVSDYGETGWTGGLAFFNAVVQNEPGHDQE